MYCNVLLVNQCGGESLGQLGEGVSETVLGVAGVTRVCFGVISAVGYGFQ